MPRWLTSSRSDGGSCVVDERPNLFVVLSNATVISGATGDVHSIWSCRARRCRYIARSEPAREQPAAARQRSCPRRLEGVPIKRLTTARVDTVHKEVLELPEIECCVSTTRQDTALSDDTPPISTKA